MSLCNETHTTCPAQAGWAAEGPRASPSSPRRAQLLLPLLLLLLPLLLPLLPLLLLLLLPLLLLCRLLLLRCLLLLFTRHVLLERRVHARYAPQVLSVRSAPLARPPAAGPLVGRRHDKGMRQHLPRQMVRARAHGLSL
jgi:hypothetical protein